MATAPLRLTPAGCEYLRLAGLLAHGLNTSSPSRGGQWRFRRGNPLTVAGAAMALAPIWVIRTMFPFHPPKTIAGVEPSDGLLVRESTDEVNLV